MTQSLSEFFREKKERSEIEVASIDWACRRMEWLNAIEWLYTDIAKWLSLPIDQGTVKLERRSRQISEDHLGSYPVDDLILSVGDEHVTFSPKGRNVAGAQGRVDVSGEAGQAMLILQPDSGWSIVTSRSPRLKLEPLDSASFAETIQAVMRQ